MAANAGRKGQPRPGRGEGGGENGGLARSAALPTGGIVVGIGASAGGLEALEQFFSAVLPPRTGIAFVVIQHLDPTHPSAMATLLTRHTAMPVTEAGGAPVEPDHVYVMPPTKIVSLSGRTLRLRERGGPGGPGPDIDVFFRSLAEELKENAVGVILSGTGRDGIHGRQGHQVGARHGDGPGPRHRPLRWNAPSGHRRGGCRFRPGARTRCLPGLVEYMSQSRGFQCGRAPRDR